VTTPAYLDVARLCEHLCISEDAIERLIARRVLPPPLLIGGCEKRWKWETIQNLLAGRVYFIEGDDFIKIGFTQSLRARLKSLQKGSPIPLKVLCSIKGGKLREAAFHETFAHLRAHGEWFKATKELRDYITVLKARPFEADQ
jgi:hypothetical protein